MNWTKIKLSRYDILLLMYVIIMWYYWMFLAISAR